MKAWAVWRHGQYGGMGIIDILRAKSNVDFSLWTNFWWNGNGVFGE